MTGIFQMYPTFYHASRCLCFLHGRRNQGFQNADRAKEYPEGSKEDAAAEICECCKN